MIFGGIRGTNCKYVLHGGRGCGLNSRCGFGVRLGGDGMESRPTGGWIDLVMEGGGWFWVGLGAERKYIVQLGRMGKSAPFCWD